MNALYEIMEKLKRDGNFKEEVNEIKNIILKDTFNTALTKVKNKLKELGFDITVELTDIEAYYMFKKVTNFLWQNMMAPGHARSLFKDTATLEKLIKNIEDRNIDRIKKEN